MIAQGTGGALTTLGSTTIEVNAPILKTPAVIHYIDTLFDDKFPTIKGSLAVIQAGYGKLTYGIEGGYDNGSTVTVSRHLEASRNIHEDIGGTDSDYGTLTVAKATGAYSFVPYHNDINGSYKNFSYDLSVTVSNGTLINTKILTISVTQKGITETDGNDKLVGSADNDAINGLYGDDTLMGGYDNDTSSGGNGNDKLNGGGNDDVLAGGIGKDRFVFNEVGFAGIDKITDFRPIDDTINLDRAIFTSLAKGVLNPHSFVIAAKAVDSNDYLIYNKNTGALFYDADGAASAEAPVQIATLGVNLPLTHADIVII